MHIVAEALVFFFHPKLRVLVPFSHHRQCYLSITIGDSSSWTGETAQFLRCLLHKHEYPSSDPRAHMKTWMQLHTLGILDGEVKTGRSLGPLD